MKLFLWKKDSLKYPKIKPFENNMYTTWYSMQFSSNYVHTWYIITLCNIHTSTNSISQKILGPLIFEVTYLNGNHYLL